MREPQHRSNAKVGVSITAGKKSNQSQVSSSGKLTPLDGDENENLESDVEMEVCRKKLDEDDNKSSEDLEMIGKPQRTTTFNIPPDNELLKEGSVLSKNEKNLINNVDPSWADDTEEDEAEPDNYMDSESKLGWVDDTSLVPIELPPPCDPPPHDDEEALSYLFIRECFMNCSAHGFPRAIESPTQIRKYIWALFTLCSISVFFYQVSFIFPRRPKQTRSYGLIIWIRGILMRPCWITMLHMA